MTYTEAVLWLMLFMTIMFAPSFIYQAVHLFKKSYPLIITKLLNDKEITDRAREKADLEWKQIIRRAGDKHD